MTIHCQSDYALIPLLAASQQLELCEVSAVSIGHAKVAAFSSIASPYALGADSEPQPPDDST